MMLLIIITTNTSTVTITEIINIIYNHTIIIIIGTTVVQPYVGPSLSYGRFMEKWMLRSSRFQSHLAAARFDPKVVLGKHLEVARLPPVAPFDRAGGE